MGHHEINKENKKPFTGKTADAGKNDGDKTMKIDQAAHRAEEGEYAGDSAMKNDQAGQRAGGAGARKPAGDKWEVEKPADDGTVKSRVEDAWDAKQPDGIKRDSENITLKAKPADGQTSAAYPDVKPIIK